MKILKKIFQFFEDSKLMASMMRLITFMTVLSCAVYPFYAIKMEGKLTNTDVAYILGALTIAFGGKAVQKKLSEKDILGKEGE